MFACISSFGCWVCVRLHWRAGTQTRFFYATQKRRAVVCFVN